VRIREEECENAIAGVQKRRRKIYRKREKDLR